MRWCGTGWDQINRKCGTSQKRQKPEKQEQLDQSEIGIQSWRWSPLPSLPFIPGERRHLLPHPLSCLTISYRDSIILSPVDRKLPRTSTETFQNICAWKHQCYNLVRRFSLLQHMKALPENMCIQCTRRQRQQCLTGEVIDSNAWYTGVKN